MLGRSSDSSLLDRTEADDLLYAEERLFLAAKIQGFVRVRATHQASSCPSSSGLRSVLPRLSTNGKKL